MAIGAAASAAILWVCAHGHGLPPYTPELRDSLWEMAKHEASKSSTSGSSSHVCGYGTWGDSGQLNQWDQGFSPCWPSTLNAAATWDVELMARWSVEMAREFGEPNRGQLGPGVNVARYAWNGRLAEYMSGEDPFLGAKMIEAQVSAGRKVNNPAVQVVKHWIPNTIEKDRNGMTEVVDERTLFEVYYPPFQAAVDAGVSAVMCSYNLVNCTSGMCSSGRAYACANDDILNKHLKDTMGFKGIVMSDWDATHCQAEAKGSGGCSAGSYIDNDFAADAGLDLEMPSCMTFSGGVSKRAEEKEARLHWAFLVQGRSIDGMPNAQVFAQYEDEHHESSAALRGRRLEDAEGQEKNDGEGFCCWWPQTGDDVCGACQNQDVRVGRSKCTGRGATWCHGPHSPSAPQKESASTGKKSAHDWLSGVYKTNPFGKASTSSVSRAGHQEQREVTLYGKSVELCPHVGKDNYKSPCKLDLAARIIAESTAVLKNSHGVLPLSKLAKVALVGAEACASSPLATAGGSGWNGFACNQVPKINVRDGIAGLKDGPRLSCDEGVEDADVVLVVVSPEKASEGRDRSTLQLCAKDVELIRKHAATGKKVVVAMNAPGPMITSTWDSLVSAIVVSWLPGQQNGRGIAMALYNEDHEASGRLPFTFPKCSTEECTHEDELASVALGDQIKENQVRVFKEKALIGYRWYHAQQRAVSFPFGFGLFAYGSAEVKYSGAKATSTGSAVTVTCKMQHSGPRAGHEVPQLYISFPSSVPGDPESKPEWVLKGFEKVRIEPDSPVEASFTLSPRDLSYWDDAPGKSLWVCAKGTFRACVGSNSRDAVVEGKGTCATFEAPCAADNHILVVKKDDSMVPSQQASPWPSAASIVAAAAASLVTVIAVVAGLRRRQQGPRTHVGSDTLQLLGLTEEDCME
mmetsp:Transcript_75110/g.189933  ORF Transcript_75110/g.189933 Transcript_75110/m.189933 type:complete len:915 (+) Transcript_75110:64-2808(+)